MNKTIGQELIFYNNPKANGKILLGLCRRNQSDGILQVGLQKYVPAALYYCPGQKGWGYVTLYGVKLSKKKKNGITAIFTKKN